MQQQDIPNTAEYENEEPLLPEGYGEGDDFFDVDAWSGQENGDTTPDAAPDEDGLPQPTAPQQEPAPEKLRFRARLDHEDRDVEIEPSELPAIWQKAQVTERVQAKLKKLMDQSLNDGQSDATPAAPKRDYGLELRELWEAYPEQRGKDLPLEVVRAGAQGTRLTQAFAQFESRQTRAENARLREENRVLRQNAAAAARAPVRGTAGGAADGPGDPFLDGFDADSW